LELNWTTFVLEILNFLVLVWLLKHFLYRPVKGVIEKRRQGIEAQLQQADDKQRQAEALREQYENRLADWESEREAARLELQHDIEEERLKQLEVLQQELAAEREKAGVLAERQLQEQQRQNEVNALEQGARFVARLLEALASPEIQAKLFEHLLHELKHLPPAQRDALQSAAVVNGKPLSVQVLSAYPLSEGQQQQLKKQIESRVPQQIQYQFHEDRKLICGLRITVGPWVMHANLHDELKTFAAIAYEH
jgi:F-type H+-transporting ATPase subunit b